VKKKSGAQAIETHDISQRKYPMPGTDLGETNAIPFNDAYDVDLSGGRQSEYCLGRGDEDSNMSRRVQGSLEALKPASNPTRLPRERYPWEGENMSVASAPTPPRKRK
jgi:hypothetical protein